MTRVLIGLFSFALMYPCGVCASPYGTGGGEIQRQIDDVSSHGGGRVIVPSGRHLVGKDVTASDVAAIDPRSSIGWGMAPVLCTHAEGDGVVPIAEFVHRVRGVLSEDAGC